MINYDGRSFYNVEDYFRYLQTKYSNEEIAQMLNQSAMGQQMTNLFNIYLAKGQFENNNISGNEFLGVIGNNNGNLNGEQEKWLDNIISQENTQSARDFETQMRDTAYLSAGNQLQQLGLSTSGVLQTGGAVSNGVAAASTSKHSAAALKQQERINNFNQKMGLAKSLISTAGSMASSGIYGAALGAIKHSASALSASAANSGLQVLKKWNGYGNGSLMTGKLADEWQNLPGAY